MPLPHPCCGGSLQTWTKAIAIVQIIRSGFVLVGGIALLTTGGLLTASASILGDVDSNGGKDSSSSNSERSGVLFDHQKITAVNADSNMGKNPEDTMAFYSFIGIVIMMASIFFILEGAVNMILSVMLYNGAANRIGYKCRVWLIVHCIFFLPGVVFFMVSTVGSDAYTSANIGSGFGLLLNAYCIWVVYEFIQELRVEEEAIRPWGLGQPGHPGLGQSVYVQEMTKA